jgi:hypothetical protein
MSYTPNPARVARPSNSPRTVVEIISRRKLYPRPITEKPRDAPRDAVWRRTPWLPFPHGCRCGVSICRINPAFYPHTSCYLMSQDSGTASARRRRIKTLGAPFSVTPGSSFPRPVHPLHRPTETKNPATPCAPGSAAAKSCSWP